MLRVPVEWRPLIVYAYGLYLPRSERISLPVPRDREGFLRVAHC